MILLIFICVYIIGYIHGSNTKTEGRFDRFENLIQYSEYGYGYFGIDDNMTMHDLKIYYEHCPHSDYVRLFTDLALDHVCDGTGEYIFRYLK